MNTLREFLEIIVAFLAVFGAWSLIRNLKESILFPKKVRMRVAAAIHDGADRNDRALEYVNYLRAERKIAPEWLIIRAKGDIIEYNKVTEGVNGAEWTDSQRTRNL